MRLHVIALPHTQLTQDYSSCAFTSLTRGFIDMMTDEGHEVIAYAAGEEYEHHGAEHVTCSAAHGTPEEAQFERWDASAPHWQVMATNAVREVHKRREPGDLICLSSGEWYPFFEPFKNDGLLTEFIAGYQGVRDTHRVYPSYAWLHTVEGHWQTAYAADGRDFDTVIPHWYDAASLQGPVSRNAGYYLYLGRLTDRKGYRIAQQVCERLGVPLVLAGPLDGSGPFRGYGEHLGPVGPDERRHLLQGAAALLAPTRYIEPFGLVSIEAQACGIPVISSDNGGFTETVENGVTGYRCRSFADYLDAAVKAPALDRWNIWRRSDRWHPETIAPQYTRYFEKLQTLWEDGWYTVPPGV